MKHLEEAITEFISKNNLKIKGLNEHGEIVFEKREEKPKRIDLSEIVYLKTDVDNSPRMVIQICIRPTGVLYELSCGGNSSFHYEMEISKQKNYSL